MAIHIVFNTRHSLPTTLTEVNGDHHIVVTFFGFSQKRNTSSQLDSQSNYLYLLNIVGT